MHEPAFQVLLLAFSSLVHVNDACQLPALSALLFLHLVVFVCVHVTAQLSAWLNLCHQPPVLLALRIDPFSRT